VILAVLVFVTLRTVQERLAVLMFVARAGILASRSQIPGPQK